MDFAFRYLHLHMHNFLLIASTQLLWLLSAICILEMNAFFGSLLRPILNDLTNNLGRFLVFFACLHFFKL
jgi:hypothetical protein